MLAAVCWLRANAGQHRYLREIEAPGVDTKFVATHRDLLSALLPAARIDATHSRAAGFAPRYGFTEPRPPIRMRVAEGFAGLDGVSEIGLRAEETTRLRVSVQRVLVIENEVTYLSAPIPPESVVIWGAGYSVGRLGRIPWVRDGPGRLALGRSRHPWLRHAQPPSRPGPADRVDPDGSRDPPRTSRAVGS